MHVLVRPRLLLFFLFAPTCVFTLSAAHDVRDVPLPTPHGKPADRPPDVDYTASRKLGTPRYPPQALRRHQSGQVLLKVLVDASGKPAVVEVEQGAGEKYFDDAAVDAVRRWVFQPALKNGQPIQAYLLVPINFTPPAAASKH